MDRTGRSHHLVIFGATSFVGQILVRYLFERHGAGGSLSWAMAGRSMSKLSEVRASLGAGGQDVPLFVADAGDEAALRRLCGETRVVVSTVGPYALYGSPLVKVCAETGTDYCDLTGEVQWIARMIDAHESTAKRSGARIVHGCGFDSIPSDLGTYFLQGSARERFGAPCPRVKLRVKAARGGASGGTVASIINVAREVTQDPAVRRMLANPFALTPGGGAGRPKQPEVRFVERDADAGGWIAPFPMSGVNTRVVHRSNALLGDSFGKDFVYDEAMLMGPGLAGWVKASTVAPAMLGFLMGAALPPTRYLLEKFVVPKPGDGPSVEAQAKGFFDIRLFGIGRDGRVIRAKVTGDRDPGYGSTGKMLGEAAACLALDVDPSHPGGFWTTASLFGDRLISRLTEHAGLTFEVMTGNG
jgi:short subunit dehydrogenase-like uncharacterized protein